ncbi:hypothetical protein P7C70_g1429, partial [Phenoliferia sp. Uapishka_3]
MSDSNTKELVQQLKTQGELITTLSHRLGVAEDINELKHLHYSYGYYLDKCLYKQVFDLFEKDGMAIFHGSVWKGEKGIHRLFVERFGGKFVGGKNGPITGYLLDHLLMQQIVHVAPDRLSAKMRARTFMQGKLDQYLALTPSSDKFSSDSTSQRDVVGTFRQTPPTIQLWEGGIYENHFGRNSVDEPWKIRRLDYHPTYHGDYALGWALTQPGWIPFFKTTYPEDPLGPDEILPLGPDGSWIWPDTHTVPFHYSHPITKEDVLARDMQAVTFQEYMATKKENGA